MTSAVRVASDKNKERKAVTKKKIESLLKRAEKVPEVLKKGWTQGPVAVDKWDSSVDPLSKKAVKWCFLGALYKAAGKEEDNFRMEYLYDRAFDEINEEGSWIIRFNEDPGRTQKQVVKMAERCLKLIRRKGEKWLDENSFA